DAGGGRALRRDRHHRLRAGRAPRQRRGDPPAHRLRRPGRRVRRRHRASGRVMAGTLGTVFRKEVLDNFRDRRTLTSALLFGPLFGPVIFGLAISLSLKQSISDASEPLALPIIGAEHAPHLVDYLRSHNITDEKGPASREA